MKFLRTPFFTELLRWLLLKPNVIEESKTQENGKEKHNITPELYQLWSSNKIQCHSFQEYSYHNNSLNVSDTSKQYRKGLIIWKDLSKKEYKIKKIWIVLISFESSRGFFVSEGGANGAFCSYWTTLNKVISPAEIPALRLQFLGFSHAISYSIAELQTSIF